MLKERGYILKKRGGVHINEGGRDDLLGATWGWGR